MFNKSAALYDFTDTMSGRLLSDKDGKSYVSMVEYAPNQKVNHTPALAIKASHIFPDSINPSPSTLNPIISVSLTYALMNPGAAICETQP